MSKLNSYYHERGWRITAEPIKPAPPVTNIFTENLGI